MNGLMLHGIEELSPHEAERTTGGTPVLMASVAIAGMMVTAFAAGVKFGYTVLGPWLVENF